MEEIKELKLKEEERKRYQKEYRIKNKAKLLWDQKKRRNGVLDIKDFPDEFVESIITQMRTTIRGAYGTENENKYLLLLLLQLQDRVSKPPAPPTPIIISPDINYQTPAPVKPVIPANCVDIEASRRQYLDRIMAEHNINALIKK